jgi:uncharacterized OB-fold protein
MTAAASSTPAVDGWFTTGDAPALLGSRCTACAATFFPPTVSFCRRPGCGGEAFERVPLSRRGAVWSYTDARYQPPPPYVPVTDPYEPFAIAAVELAAESIVVLGQVADGYGLDSLKVGTEVELVIEPLFADDDHEYVVWKWRPADVG